MFIFRNGCSIAACIVEASFVRNAQFWSFGNSLEPEFRHADAGKGTFVVADSCPTTPGTPSSRSCCGSYPKRFPYRTVGGSRQCCVNKVFNSETLDCCNDGSIKIVGSC